MSVIPCQQNAELKTKIVEFAEVLKTQSHQLGEHSALWRCPGCTRCRGPDARYTGRIMRALVLALLLTGCAAPEPTMGRSDFRVQIVETPDIRHPSLLGWTMYDKDTNTCYITLRKYPICLLHEIRHCIEGPWHGDKRNNEDC